MVSALLNSTILVSAFLNPNPNGAAMAVVRAATVGAFRLHLSEYILRETEGALLRPGRHRKRLAYMDESVLAYCAEIRALSTTVGDLPAPRVVRDPNDDRILAAAVLAKLEYLVSRDLDLLTLAVHEEVRMITPEAFLAVLRERGDLKRQPPA